MEAMHTAHWPDTLRPYQEQALHRVEELWQSRHRYLLSRHVLTAQGSGAHPARGPGARAPVTTVHHAVPALLGRNREGARAFERAWCRRVSDGEVLHTRHGHAQQVWPAHLGSDPAEVATAHRLMWESDRGPTRAHGPGPDHSRSILRCRNSSRPISPRA